MLGEIALGVGVHVAGHHARNGLLAKVIDEEVVELDGGRGCRFCDWSVAEVECLGFVSLDFDVVEVNPAPAIGDGDGVFAGCEVHDCFNVGKFALVGHVECHRRGGSANFDVVNLGSTVIVHVVENDGVFACFFDGHLGKSDVTAVHLDVFAARSCGVCGDSCVFCKCSVFRFIRGRKDGIGCGQSESEEYFFEIHVHSLNSLFSKYNEKIENAIAFSIERKKICLQTLFKCQISLF